MSDEQSDPPDASINPPTQSQGGSQYRQTAILGVLVFAVLPAAYYFIGLRTAALVTLVSLFLIMYSTTTSE